MTDKEFLDGIYSDDAESFMLLIDTYADLVNDVVCDILYEVNQRDTQECVADSFLAFYNNIDDVDLSKGSIKGYLGVIARRRAVNLYYTLYPDATEVFDEYTVEEMSTMLENKEAQENKALSDVIAKFCLDEIAPEMFEENLTEESYGVAEGKYEESEVEPTAEFIEKKSRRFGKTVKFLIVMVSLVAVIAVAVIAVDKFSVSEDVTTTTQTTTKKEPFNPLLSAIIAGNEKLIEELISNSLLLTDEVLRFAVESADKISYDNIRRIAEEVKEKYGSTGLDPILDRAIFGDFKSVRDKLKNKDESELTSAEKLAKFFAETIGGETW